MRSHLALGGSVGYIMIQCVLLRLPAILVSFSIDCMVINPCVTSVAMVNYGCRQSSNANLLRAASVLKYSIMSSILETTVFQHRPVKSASYPLKILYVLIGSFKSARIRSPTGLEPYKRDAISLGVSSVRLDDLAFFILTGSALHPSSRRISSVSTCPFKIAQ